MKLRVAVLGPTLARVHAAIESEPIIPESAIRLSARSVRHYGSGRGHSYDVLVVVCRWNEWHDLLDVIDLLRPCFATVLMPEIRWLIEQ